MIGTAACALAVFVQHLAAVPITVRDPNSTGYLRLRIKESPSNGVLQAQLAIALLAPVEEVVPNGDEGSLYGDQFTLYHPNVAEARRALDIAMQRAPQALETDRAHTMVLMAEGHGEDAIQPGRRVVEKAPKSAASHILLARAHLLAGCAQACQCRELLRKEKRSEKRSGRKSALEKREEEAEESQRRQEASKDPSKAKPMMKDRGSLRAGSSGSIASGTSTCGPCAS